MALSADDRRVGIVSRQTLIWLVAGGQSGE